MPNKKTTKDNYGNETEKGERDMKDDIKRKDLTLEDAQDRDIWRGCCRLVDPDNLG